MTEQNKLCFEGCFQYDPDLRGCSYTEMDFTGTERIEPGQPCLHPDFDETKLIEGSMISLCAALEFGLEEIID